MCLSYDFKADFQKNPFLGEFLKSLFQIFDAAPSTICGSPSSPHLKFVEFFFPPKNGGFFSAVFCWSLFGRTRIWAFRLLHVALAKLCLGPQWPRVTPWCPNCWGKSSSHIGLCQAISWQVQPQKDALGFQIVCCYTVSYTCYHYCIYVYSRSQPFFCFFHLHCITPPSYRNMRKECGKMSCNSLSLSLICTYICRLYIFINVYIYIYKYLSLWHTGV